MRSQSLLVYGSTQCSRRKSPVTSSQHARCSSGSRATSDLSATVSCRISSRVPRKTSAMRVTEVADARHRRPVITDVMAAVSRLYGVAWSDVRMYANDPKHSACGEAMQVTAVIACDYLRKDARSVSRVLACSESDIAKLLDRARTNASGQLKANIRAACRELGIVSV